ncbi:MAG: 4Fe-4S dicluster domain-containing protein [Deferrisomatales bacterium]
MIANYGYRDAEGEFYITVDTGRCAGCGDKPCVRACPGGVLAEEEDPYGEAVVAVGEAKRRKLKYECARCKPSRGRLPLPCVAACPCGAVTHSW